jgi:hypothetical protein
MDDKVDESGILRSRDKHMRLICVSALLFVCFGIPHSFTAACFGQIDFDQSNWLKEIGRRDNVYSRFDLTRYTKSDVENAKAKYFRITSVQPVDEWEGRYDRGSILGTMELIWNSRDGFVYFYVYHTLGGLNFGQVRTNGTAVSFTNEGGSKSTWLKEGDFVKVMFGERHLLVPRSRLGEFAEFAAGLNLERSLDEPVYDDYFYEKSDDSKKPIAEVPDYPKAYRHLLRKPIRATVISVGRLEKKRETTESDMTSPEHVRLLSLSKGAAAGVKVGMTFWIDELEERVEIISVSPSRSTARLLRHVFDGVEQCQNYEDLPGEFECREPKAGMRARTRTQHFRVH